MNLQVIKIRILSWLKRVFLYTLYFTLAFFLLSFGVFQIPAVQRTAAKYFTDRLSVASGFTTTFESFYLVWYDRLMIEGLSISDPEGNTMIAAKKLAINFRISYLFDDQDVNIDAATVDGADVNLVKLQENDSTKDLNINIFISRLSKRPSNGQQGSAKVNIGEIILSKSKFSYNDPWKDSLAPKFDYNHFRLALDDGELNNFKVIGDTIQFKVNSLAAVDEQTQFDIKNISTSFRISQRSMEFVDLKLDAGSSHIEDSVVFTYPTQLALNDFNNKVNINANLKNTTIYPEDLAYFAPGVEKIRDPINITGEISGKVSRLYARDLRLAIGDTRFNGKVDMDGLPYINETFINLSLLPSTVNINDLAFAFPPRTFKGIKPLGEFQLSGNFTGFINDFVANGVFNGNFGKISSDVNLKINSSNPELSQYRGNIELTNFRLNTYLKDTTLFKSVSLKGHIDGRGFTEDAADFKLNGEISHLAIKNYDYKNIVTDARFRSQFFNGTVTIDDPNLKLNAEGSIDFSNPEKLVKVKMNLDTALLHNLGLSKDLLFIRSDINIDSRGLKIDSLFGQASFTNTLVSYKDQSLSVDSVYLISSKLDNGRSLLLKSTLADINLHGEYYYSSLFNDVNNLFKEFYLTIKNDKEALARHYENKTKRAQDYNANFNIILRDINPAIEVAGFDLKLSKNTLIEGEFSNGITSIFSTYSEIDTVYYRGKEFVHNTIEFSGSKVRDSTDILAMLTVISDKQSLSKAFNSENMIAEAIWNSDHIELGLDFDQTKTNNYVRAKAAVDFLNDSTRIKVLPSRFRALDEIWNVSQNNFTLFHDQEWNIRQLAVNSGDQAIILEGDISKDPAKTLELQVKNLNLDFLNTVSGEKFTGVVNGSAEARDLYNNPYIQNDISIKALTINDFLIGDISGINVWNQQNQRFDIDFSIDRLNTRTVALKGFYNPREDDPLHVQAKLNKANLKIAEPLLQHLFAQMGGELTGTYNISGTFGQPKIEGKGDIENGQIMINYLKTLYSFTGEFEMTPSQLVFNNFSLSDVLKNKGTLNGFIAHRNFNEFRLNLDATFNNFQLLNTTSRDNSLFYGQGYASGNANLFGPSDNLKISATARTERNTRIFIPMTSSESVEKKDYINFVHFTDTVALAENDKRLVKRNPTSSGLSMDINLDITPDAYTEIIFDIKSGDIIRGRGNGDIKLQLDTKGDFFMFGAVEFTQGAYNFTLYDIINKEFDIEPGSRITWYGNPYEGIMDINASYRQMASLIPLLPDQSEEVISN
ncbi:MAG: translocation/assembly module TamB domain-containing protein, partial [Cyclobacteriaceae bacterium]